MGEGLRDARACGPFIGEFVQDLGDARGAEQVHLDGAVQGRVEGHRGRGVDDDVTRPEQGSPGLVERQPVSSDVAGDRVETAGDHIVKTLAKLTA